MGRWLNRTSLSAIDGNAELPEAREDIHGTCSLESQSLPPRSSEVKHRYIVKGVERTATFPADGNEDVSGALLSAPSGALKEYEDKLKAIALRVKGMEKAEIATLLSRSEHWVKRWWRQEPHLIPKPNVRHAPLVQNAPLLSFRDLDLRRSFAPGGDELVQELTTSLQWEPARRATRHPDTGELRVRFDTAGNSMTQAGRFVAAYKGGIDALDAVLQKMTHVANIRDPGLRIFLNRYESGGATCPSHRHDFWTAMVSFGAARVAIIEERPMLLRDGDLLVFGTQSHSCPEMPTVNERRISIVIFFRPDADNLERRWGSLANVSTETDGETQAEGNRDGLGQDLHLPVSDGYGKLVDSELCGCPGISLGLVSRRCLVLSSPVTLFTVGCHLVQLNVLTSRLHTHQIDQVWDVRCYPVQSGSHLSSENLKRMCNSHGIQYRHVPLGHAANGGIEKHIATEEGRDTLSRMLLSASQGLKVAIMGNAEVWRGCERETVASALTCGEFGLVSVLHVGPGGVEPHPTELALPRCSAALPSNQHIEIDNIQPYSTSECNDVPNVAPRTEGAAPPGDEHKSQIGRANRFSRGSAERAAKLM